MKFKVKRLGSFGDSKTDFIVRLCKADREHLAVRGSALVKVKKGNKKVTAIVKKQFIDLASYPEACSVNSLLTKFLRLKKDDKIEISANVTQAEADEYTSDEQFKKRQVVGLLLTKHEKKEIKDIMKNLNLFADEQKAEETARDTTESGEGDTDD